MGTQNCEKEACEKQVRKSLWCFVKAWISNWRYSLHNTRNSLHISKTLNFNNFETESQIFTVIVVHKILVPLGVPGWPHCFTVFTGLLDVIISKSSNKHSGQAASMQHHVSLLHSFNLLNCHLLTTMKISSLTTNNPHFLFYWITSNCWCFLFRKQRKKEDLRNKQNSVKESLVSGSSLFPPALFKVQRIGMQENIFKSFWNRSIMVYYYWSTETTFQYKALLTRAISWGNAADPI